MVTASEHGCFFFAHPHAGSSSDVRCFLKALKWSFLHPKEILRMYICIHRSVTQFFKHRTNRIDIIIGHTWSHTLISRFMVATCKVHYGAGPLSKWTTAASNLP